MCNHPELFERADVVAPYSFSRFGQSRSLLREGDSIFLPYSTRNPIEFSIPQLLYQDGGLIDVPSDASAPVTSLSCLTKRFNIWSTNWIHQSLYDEGAQLRPAGYSSSDWWLSSGVFVFLPSFYWCDTARCSLPPRCPPSSKTAAWRWRRDKIVWSISLYIVSLSCHYTLTPLTLYAVTLCLQPIPCECRHHCRFPASLWQWACLLFHPLQRRIGRIVVCPDPQWNGLFHRSLPLRSQCIVLIGLSLKPKRGSSKRL